MRGRGRGAVLWVWTAVLLCGGALVVPATVAGAVAHTVSWADATATAREGDQLVVTVTRSDPTDDASVDVVLAPGNEVRADIFGATDPLAAVIVSEVGGPSDPADDGTLVFPSGETSRQIVVVPLDDDFGETPVDLLLDLANPVDATVPGDLTVDQGKIAVTIADEATGGSAGTLTFATTAHSAQESDNEESMVVAVTRAGGSEGAVSATIDATPGSATAADFDLPGPSTMSFGVGITADTFEVAITGDQVAEAAESFELALSGPTNGVSIGGSPATVTITDDDDAPIGGADSYFVAEDDELTVAAPGVLANDSDADTGAGSLDAVSATSAVHGTVSLNANGSFGYEPDADFTGTDTFTYRVSDGPNQSNPVTVIVQVEPQADAPVAAADSYSVVEDSPLAALVPGVLANDLDPDLDVDALSVVVVEGVKHGTLTATGGGSLSYRPVANYSGPDSFTYRASDGELQSAVVEVSITVDATNDAPIAVPDSYAVVEDSPLAALVPGVLANDLDPDLDVDALSVVVVEGVKHGTLTATGGGSLSYRPVANYSGPDSFTYRVSDGTAQSAPVEVSIAVDATDDAPVANSDSFSIAEDGLLVVAAPGVLDNDTDADQSPLTAVLIDDGDQGTVELMADGSFTYDSVADFFGPDSFTYQASDGTAQSEVATVSIVVTAVNDPPVVPPTVAVWLLEAGAQRFNLAAAPGLGDVDTPPADLDVTPASASTTRDGELECEATVCTYTSPPGFVGVDTIDFSLSDGSASTNSTMLIYVGFPRTSEFAGTGCTIDRAVTPAADGSAGNDVICGTNGNDTINGGGGNDLIVGYDGDDTLTGGLGDDQLHGWIGTDVLDPGAGTDRSVGGAGNDTVRYGATSANDTVELTATGAALPHGTDTHALVETVSLAAGAGDDDVELVPGTGVRFELDGGLGFDFLSRPAGTPAASLTVTGFEAITGGVNLSVGSPGNDLRRYLGSAAVGLKTDMLAGSDRVEVSFGSLLGPVEVTDSGPSSDTDRLTVVASGGPDTVVLKGLTLSRNAGTRTERVILSGQEALTIVMAGGNDLLDLDLRGVAPAALAGPRSVLVDGGSGVDTLKIHSPSIECGSVGTGRLTLPGYGTISLAGVETVEIDCFDGRRTNVLSLVDGYWLVDRGGAVSRFGPVGSYGRPATIPGIPVIGIAAAADKQGYWTVRSNGSVDRFGSAPFVGDIPDLQKRGILGPLNAPVVGIAATNTGRGYYMLGRDGGIFTFGNARFFGSTGSIQLNKRVTAMAAHPAGKGYWFVAEDGGVFTFGPDAAFQGSVPGVLPPGVSVSKPVVGIAPTASGRGYWLVAADGGVFAFGDARYYGSVPGVLGGRPLNRPVVGIVPTVTGKGYWIVAEDGGVFTFGDARFFGSLGGGGGGRVVALAG